MSRYEVIEDGDYKVTIDYENLTTTFEMNYQRELLNELKEFLTERMVDNMSTKDLEEYVSNDLFNYFDKLGEHEFLEECRNYWDDAYDDVIAEISDYMKCDFKKEKNRDVHQYGWDGKDSISFPVHSKE